MRAARAALSRPIYRLMAGALWQLHKLLSRAALGCARRSIALLRRANGGGGSTIKEERAMRGPG